MYIYCYTKQSQNLNVKTILFNNKVELNTN